MPPADAAMDVQVVTSTWLRFVQEDESSSGRTKRWNVISKEGAHLGAVAWYGPWRCYAFHPVQATVFERKCLRDLADFCERETMARRRNV